MIVGLSYDLKAEVAHQEGLPDDALEEYDSDETIEALKKAIELKGHTVIRLGGGRQFLENILSQKVDFVFNISEGLGCYKSREAQVPSVLEMLGIPYSGSDPQCLSVCLDKDLTKTVVAAGGVKTPEWQTINHDGRGFNSADLKYPVFVKPTFEGSSKGIRFNSFVQTAERMEEVVPELVTCYKQPVLVEQYIGGEEITVGVVGNNPPRVLGIMRVVPKQKQDNFIYTQEVKRDYENLVDYECPAKLAPDTLKMLEEASLKIFKILGCRDFARVDFRVDASGIPYFLEINPLAGLNPRSSDIVIMSRLIGISYTDLIGTIFEAAVKRYKDAA